MVDWLKKEVKEIKKEEEKVVFKIHRFKIKKKLFFSVLLSLLVAIIGFSKVKSLHKIGMHISYQIVLLTLIICALFLFIIVIRKNISFFIKQIFLVFISLFVILILITIGGLYNLLDLLFIAIIITTISVSIYDIF